MVKQQIAPFKIRVTPEEYKKVEKVVISNGYKLLGCIEEESPYLLLRNVANANGTRLMKIFTEYEFKKAIELEITFEQFSSLYTLEAYDKKETCEFAKWCSLKATYHGQNEWTLNDTVGYLTTETLLDKFIYLQSVRKVETNKAKL